MSHMKDNTMNHKNLHRSLYTEIRKFFWINLYISK
uniref:Uncharacterized protein n=1 Tax=Arundo donax TaxID=35708 RepID=A0A0A8YAU7_ARUDO